MASKEDRGLNAAPRHRAAGAAALPDVMLRAVEPCRDGGNADAQPGVARHAGVADREPVAERGHQLGQRQQEHAARLGRRR